MKTITTSSSASTKKLGEKLAKKISKTKSQASKVDSAFVIALSGELGAGKTTFVQGFTQGLGIKRRTMSPTFIIFRRYAIRRSRFTNLYHVDAYRIKNTKELVVLEFSEILSNPKNIVLIEWPENIKLILPKKVFRVKFRHGKKEHERIIGV